MVTNSLPIAQLLASNQQTELILIGGYVYPRTGVALGPLAIATMRTIRVRLAVLGAGGIMAEGIYNSNSLLVETERQMMSCGQEIMIVADHTKFGRLALARLCGLEEVNQFVVDSGVSEEDRSLDRARPARRFTWHRSRKADRNGSRARGGQGRHFEDRGMSTVATPTRDQVESVVRNDYTQARDAARRVERPHARMRPHGQAGGEHLGAALPLDPIGRRYLVWSGVSVDGDASDFTRTPTSPPTRRLPSSAPGSG